METNYSTPLNKIALEPHHYTQFYVAVYHGSHGCSYNEPVVMCMLTKDVPVPIIDLLNDQQEFDCSGPEEPDFQSKMFNNWWFNDAKEKKNIVRFELAGFENTVFPTTFVVDRCFRVELIV